MFTKIIAFKDGEKITQHFLFWASALNRAEFLIEREGYEKVEIWNKNKLISKVVADEDGYARFIEQH